jgi:hypothetical protein
LYRRNFVCSYARRNEIFEITSNWLWLDGRGLESKISKNATIRLNKRLVNLSFGVFSTLYFDEVEGETATISSLSSNREANNSKRSSLLVVCKVLQSAKI